MRLIYIVYLCLVAAPIMLTITVLTALAVIVGSALGAGDRVGYYLPKWWSKLMCWLTLVRVSVTGRENISPTTSYMFVANHQGAYDIFAIYGWLGHNFKWMMKKSLGKIPLVGFACEKAGHIMVDRSSPAAVRKTVETAEATLRGGMSIVVFPEGARTFTGEVGRFKKGAYQLALEFGLPMVPITIDGAFAVMPRTSMLPRPGHIKVTIHKPVAPPLTEEERQTAIDLTREAIISGLSKTK